MVLPGPLTARPIAPGEEREFFRLYRRHPGVPRWFSQSREALAETAKAGTGDGRAFLLAWHGPRAVAAIALERQAGRRALCFFPMVEDADGARPAALEALGEAARHVAREWGARLLEAEVVPDARTASLEAGLSGIGLARVTDRLLLERSLSGTPADAPEPREHPGSDAVKMLAEIYASSADPAVRHADAADDLALMRDEHPTATIGAFEHDGSRAGICVAAVERGRGTILFTGLLPAFQRRGLGTPLLHGGLALLRRRGARRARLAVSRENVPALRLYLGLGFRQVGETHLYRASVDPAGAGSGRP